MNWRKNLKIGFKFCGGCNPRYDRKAVYEGLVSKVNDTCDISLAKDNETYDYIIILAGCPNACADCSRLDFKRKKIIITKISQVDDIMKHLPIIQ
jgi:4-hydroxybutyrate CoA-transferase